MPTVVTEKPPAPLPDEPRRKRWTREDCKAVEGSGLWDREHLELIEGELISKMGKNRPHTNAITIMNAWLIRVFGEKYVQQEAPIDVARDDNPINEPEPDLIVLSKSCWEFASNPPSSELRLVVEIADSSLRFDLSVKARLYARAGISDYWVFDVASRRLVVHRDPRNGSYHSITSYSEEESVAPLAAPDHAFPVAAAFSPARNGLE